MKTNGLVKLDIIGLLVCACYIYASSHNRKRLTKLPCPSPACICNGIKATCVDEDLTYIPTFPRTIRRIFIQNVNLGHISEKSFSNLTYNHVESLQFINCSIKSLNEKSFMNVTDLAVIAISQNPSLTVVDVQRSFKYLNHSYLRKLIFTYNSWDMLPDDMFQSFQGGRLERIDLTGNKFRILNLTAFTDLPSLYHLNIRSNLIAVIVTKPILNLKKLTLGDNKLTEIPDLCDEKGNSYLPRLISLTLDNNILTELFQFHCLPSLMALSVVNNLIKIVPGNAFSDLPLLQILNLQQAGNPLKRIEDYAFNSSSLITLNIRHCNFHFERMDKSAIANLFNYSRALEHLDLSQNFLPRDPQTLLSLLSHPYQLKRLCLDTTRLYHLPEGVFFHLKNIEELVLSGNSITSWGHGHTVFGNLTFLKVLDLSANLITIINETSFPASLLSSLQIINLSQNTFYCVCEQMWFVNWLRNTKVSLQRYPYVCAQPKQLIGIELKKYNPTIESCTPWNPLFTVAISMSSFGVLVFVVIIIIFKCQVNIKNYIYVLRVQHNRRKGYLAISNEEDFQYHAFVVYCDADRQWVHKEFVRKLETEEGFKFCIHQRDFDVGETISGNIDSSLKKSWKVVVVMSNAFAKSEWYQWEVDIVQESRRRQGREVFLLIMLNNITSRNMTSPLRTLLDSTPHLGFKKGVGETLFWKAVIEGLRKPIGLSPVSEL